MYTSPDVFDTTYPSDACMYRLRSRPETLSSLVSRLDWRRDTKLAHLGGCFPTPLFGASNVAGQALDPIEALLEARGYGSRSRTRGPTESAAERAKKDAKALRSGWLDLSSSLAGASLDRPFSASVMARDANLDRMRPTLGAIDSLLPLKEPLAHGYVLPSLSPQTDSH